METKKASPENPVPPVRERFSEEAFYNCQFSHLSQLRKQLQRAGFSTCHSGISAGTGC